MFSGIIEVTAKISNIREIHPGLIRVLVKRPAEFNDLKRGDSIAVNGICLTLEDFDLENLQFALGAETLKVLKGDSVDLKGAELNLERSLRLGDRIHGHLVSGHVDEKQKVVQVENFSEVKKIKVAFSKEFKNFLYPKGSITINGVSLTVNSVNSESSCDTGSSLDSLNYFEVCIIPETLKRTNLGQLEAGASVLLEYDWMSKNFVNLIKNYLTEL